MREFTLGHLGESQSAPGGRELVSQAANLTFESACRLLYAEHSPIAMQLQYYSTIWFIGYSFTAPEGGRLSSPRQCSNCAACVQSCILQWFSWKHRNLSAVRGFDPGTSRAADKRATTKSLRPVNTCKNADCYWFHITSGILVDRKLFGPYCVLCLVTDRYLFSCIID